MSLPIRPGPAPPMHVNVSSGSPNAHVGSGATTHLFSAFPPAERGNMSPQSKSYPESYSSLQLVPSNSPPHVQQLLQHTMPPRLQFALSRSAQDLVNVADQLTTMPPINNTNNNNNSNSSNTNSSSATPSSSPSLTPSTQSQPPIQVSSEVSSLLLQLADDFVSEVAEFACKIAQHRKSNTVDVRDVKLYLDVGLNMHVPGFNELSSSSSLMSVPHVFTSEYHRNRLATLNRAKAKLHQPSTNPSSTTSSSPSTSSSSSSSSSSTTRSNTGASASGGSTNKRDTSSSSSSSTSSASMEGPAPKKRKADT